ncbi:MAG: PAS domain-containing protein [Rhodospirillaceae bacterium]|nr:PAS domain-containing protein [Rhodospirillaceae bacterium]
MVDGPIGLAVLDEFARHWRDRRRGGAAMPTLSDYLDRPHPTLQPWTIIIDLADGSWPVRLCGTGMADMMGSDFTGGDYLTAVRPSERGEIVARDRTCATHPCGLRLNMVARTAEGRLIDNAVLVLPVSRAGGHSLVRVSAARRTAGWSDPPLAVLGYTAAAWVDVDHGVPVVAPWFNPRAARADGAGTIRRLPS